ncbi:PAS domain-containing protein [Rhodovulum iodosum]|uniref:PAS domain-containing protein n=1 Tax=Rhodovulum iodosum TaxID=68291 RepID=A0ABV3XRJ6_9RHOB|nr:PAS domain-containing protein [Rhodovulum robiginosum]RSK30302.1 PAS domain-containing protein [Rhodovulum robiginosum]
MTEGWAFTAILFASSFAAAVGALLLVARLPARLIACGTPPPDMLIEDTVFLFEGDRLVDASPAASRLLAQGPPGMGDRARLMALLVPRFPALPGALDDLRETGLAVLDEAGGPARLRLRQAGGAIRLSLLERGVGGDGAAGRALLDELAQLRALVDGAPALAWREDGRGAVVWANRAYLDHMGLARADGAGLVWPLPNLFRVSGQDAGSDDAPRRVSLTLPDGKARWFDLSRQPEAGGTLCFAQPADAAVRAESALGEFHQTLTKTFADLPIGLAVFNRARQLVLFNPALAELCALEPEFLTARPRLGDMLDRLREKRMMPEQKDYPAWRDAITRLEKDAASGGYEETWSLPSGLTYRVTGRPHPDGAIAFLFQDISGEIALTRRFRAEMETGQAVLDGLPEAIAVFDAAGVLVAANAAYTRLWGQDPNECLGQIGLAEAGALWQARCQTDAAWSAMQAALWQIDRRAGWQGALTLRDGAVMSGRIAPLAGGARLVAFGGAGDGSAADAPAPALSSHDA